MCAARTQPGQHRPDTRDVGPVGRAPERVVAAVAVTGRVLLGAAAHVVDHSEPEPGHVAVKFEEPQGRGGRCCDGRASPSRRRAMRGRPISLWSAISPDLSGVSRRRPRVDRRSGRASGVTRCRRCGAGQRAEAAPGVPGAPRALDQLSQGNPLAGTVCAPIKVATLSGAVAPISTASAYRADPPVADDVVYLSGKHTRSSTTALRASRSWMAPAHSTRSRNAVTVGPDQLHHRRSEAVDQVYGSPPDRSPGAWFTAFRRPSRTSPSPNPNSEPKL